MDENSEDTGLGAAFYFKIAGIALLIGIAAFAVVLIFFEALFAWGVLGAFAFLAAASLGAGWIADRRRERSSF
jgi:hypothetical protein